MRRAIVLCFSLLAIASARAATGAETWSISARQPCTGLTAGFAKPLADLNELVGPHWRAAAGPVKDQGLVLLFVTACPNSAIAGKPSGAVSSAFVLVPVKQKGSAQGRSHTIVVLQAAGRAGTPVMKLFQRHGVPVRDAHVSLNATVNSSSTRAEAIVHFTGGTLTVHAEMQPDSAPYRSTDTVAVRAQPAGALFSGPEASTRYAHGKARARATTDTWIQDYGLGQPLFVTLDTDFTWTFDFAAPPRN